ncbi:MAG: DUF4910 domain-containing protein [Candidatus Andersenbacteria bacterium]|nr:DUF4910 domain-containing protein [Candidatus Andersenbacteria bacterium]
MRRLASDRVRSASARPAARAGADMYRLIERLYPLCRSITGEGVRETLRILSEYVPLSVHEVASGTGAFDWTVPEEWTLRSAYIKNERGEVVVDVRHSNLYLMGYSEPMRATLRLAELKEHLHTLPDHPDWIPYRTSYYQRAWGFCLAHRQLSAWPNEKYEVVIDSELKAGSLTYGELYLAGEVQDEVLFSTYVCHPSLCNDNLSGVALTTFLAQQLARWPRRRYSYRFLFVPETIGALVWLGRNEARLPLIRHGLVVTCVGDRGQMTYKRSRQGAAEIDRAVAKVLDDSGQPHRIVDFFPAGSDERQYCSPGFDLPVGSLMRTPYGEFPEYHTSADNLEFVSAEHLADSLARYLEVVEVLEKNRVYVNQVGKGEPQLGRRGLYDSSPGVRRELAPRMALLWVLNLSDGRHSLLDIAERSGMTWREVTDAAYVLVEQDLLK